MIDFVASEKFEIIMPDPLSLQLKGFFIDLQLKVRGTVIEETGMILNLKFILDCFEHLNTLRPKGFAFPHLLDVKDFFKNEIETYFKSKNISSYLFEMHLQWAPTLGSHFSITVPFVNEDKLKWKIKKVFQIENKSSLGFYLEEHVLEAFWKCEDYFNSFDHCTLQNLEWQSLLQDLQDRQDEKILQQYLKNSQPEFGAELIRIDWILPSLEKISFRKD